MYGLVRSGRRGEAWHGTASRGAAGEASPGWVRFVWASWGTAGEVGYVEARCGLARLGSRGMVGCVALW